MEKPRLLKANEIECRVGMCKENGCTLLLYKDARADMHILDETYGQDNWQRTHEVINGNLFCNVEVWDEKKKCWIKKQDVGTESMTEKEKGQASDSFKRACVNWGIGRELYTSPFIWINASDIDIKENNGKFSTYDKFEVEKITYLEDGSIDGLSIINSKSNKRVFVKKPTV